jgi:GDP-mannose transporter
MSLVFSIFAYAFTSSTLLVANKWGISVLPSSHVLMTVQFAGAALAVAAAYAAAGRRAELAVPTSTIIAFAPAVAVFYATLWTNLAALEASSVDTVILFRTLSPFAVAIGDFVWLGRAWPSARSWFSLIAIGTSCTFIFTRETAQAVDTEATWTGWYWCALYYAAISADQLILKRFIANVPLSTSQRVLYMNSLALIPSVFSAAALGDLSPDSPTVAALSSALGGDLSIAGPIVLTILLGLGISYAAWYLRARVSALTFTLIGVLCKIGSIALNALMFKHMETRSMLLIILAIAASTFYTQPPAQKGAIDVNKVAEEGKAGANRSESSDDELLKSRAVREKEAAANAWTARELMAGAILYLAILGIGFAS